LIGMHGEGAWRKKPEIKDDMSVGVRFGSWAGKFPHILLSPKSAFYVKKSDLFCKDAAADAGLQPDGLTCDFGSRLHNHQTLQRAVADLPPAGSSAIGKDWEANSSAPRPGACRNRRTGSRRALQSAMAPEGPFAACPELVEGVQIQTRSDLRQSAVKSAPCSASPIDFGEARALRGERGENPSCASRGPPCKFPPRSGRRARTGVWFSGPRSPCQPGS
jgi:hypothetical protein